MIGLRLAAAVLAAAGLIAAGCGGDEDEPSEDTETSASTMPGAEEAAAFNEGIADLSDEEQIVAVGEEWADLFGAKDEQMCGYLDPALGGPSSCSLFAQGSLTGSSILMKEFTGATVESVEIDGDTALAEFSNGHTVKFTQTEDGVWAVIETPQVAGTDKPVQPS